jgi:hypothetical protein
MALNVPIKTLVMIYISIKMQLISTMAHVSIETHLAFCVPTKTLVMVYISIGNRMALTMTDVFIRTCFPFIFSSNLDYGLHLHLQSSLSNTSPNSLCFSIIEKSSFYNPMKMPWIHNSHYLNNIKFYDFQHHFEIG